MPYKILVIENSPEEWEFFRDLFELRGDKAVWVSDETTAEEEFALGQYDMVLMEALLPKRSGYELCKILKETGKGKTTPILLLGSVLQSFKVAHQVRTKYLADDVLVRPYDIEDMEQKFALHLEGIKPKKAEAPREDPLGITERTEEPLDFSKVKIVLPFEGTFDKIPFPRVLAYFSFLNEDGSLFVEDGQVSKSIVFKKGIPVAVYGSIRGESIGQILLQNQKITETHLNDAIQTAIDSGKRLGEVLLEMGVITPHELYETILRQAEDKILEIFTWEAGRYSFSLGLPDRLDELGIDINITDLILRGVQRYWDAESVKQEFDHEEMLILYPVKGGFEKVKKSVTFPKVRRILDQINGKTTPDQIIADLNLDRVETLKILLALIMLEAAVLAPPTLAVDPGPRIEKDLGERLNRDATPAGRDYWEMIFKNYQTIASRSLDQLLDAKPGNVDIEALKSHSEGILRKLVGDDVLYKRADQLTQARVDYIRDRYAKALELYTDPERFQAYLDRNRGDKGKSVSTVLLQSELEFRKGLEAFEKGDYPTARIHFEKACEIHGYTAEYFSYLGYVIYLTSGDDDPIQQQEALETLKKAIKINPHIDLPYQFMGMIYRDRNSNEKAEELFEKAFEYNPRSLETLKELRKLYLARKLAAEQKQPSSSRTVMEYKHKITELYNKMGNISFFELLGATEEESHDDLQKKYFDLAAEYRPNEMFEQLDEINQERAEEVFQRLTDAYATLIDRDGRREYLESLKFSDQTDRQQADLPPTSPELAEEANRLYLIGREQMKNREFKNASLQFRRAFEADPNQKKYQAYMAYAIYRAFKSSSESHQSAVIKAKELLRHTLSMDPNCAAAYVLLGRIYLEEGKKLLSEEQAEQALRIDPENIEALSLYRKIHSRYQAISRAQYLQKEVAKVESLREKFVSAYEVMRRQNYFDLLEVPRGAPPDRIKAAYQKAIDKFSYEEIYDKCPSDMRVVLENIVSLLNKAYTVLSDSKAQESYVSLLDERAVEERFDVMHMEDPRQIFSRAQVMIKEGLYDQAVKALKKARSLSPLESIYSIWLGYAMFRAKPEDPRVRDTAKEMIDGALDLNENSADAYYFLGKIFAQEGDEETAVGLYRKATLVDPKHTKANLELSLRQKRKNEAAEARSTSLFENLKALFKRKKSGSKKR